MSTNELQQQVTKTLEEEESESQYVVHGEIGILHSGSTPSLWGLPYSTSTRFWDPLPPLCPQNLYCLSAKKNSRPPPVRTSYMEVPFLDPPFERGKKRGVRMSVPFPLLSTSPSLIKSSLRSSARRLRCDGCGGCAVKPN